VPVSPRIDLHTLACIAGTVTPEILRELFNAVLANMVPDPISQPPVMEVKPDPTGRGGGCRPCICHSAWRSYKKEDGGCGYHRSYPKLPNNSAASA
jgi:hypothetical protein